MASEPERNNDKQSQRKTGENLRSLGQWFKHEECQGSGAAVTPCTDGGGDAIPPAWHPGPRAPHEGCHPARAMPGTCPAQGMQGSSMCQPSVPSKPGWQAGSLFRRQGGQSCSP